MMYALRGRFRCRRASTPLFLLLLVCAAGWSGCAALSRLRFEPLGMQLQGIRLDRLDGRGGTVTLNLAVYNPNSYEIRATRIEADLRVEGTRLGATAVDGDFALAEKAHTTLQLPVSFSWEGVGTTARSLLERGSVSYELEARFRVDTGTDLRNLRLRRNGEVGITGSRRERRDER